ncbi:MULTISPECIES: primosomal protein N' [unclassified Psychrobacter]|uniref:primosomal protein N' n=1 Tax=unclassified Psychrobacter TaxID=196806 RepID=UPI0025B51411|nr:MULTISPECIES: primosomal protein N' [unclassified Psychrobacter]MDN3452528.1 primosomal protein N' [Psychrobacter sp. APC 3350]MDN3502332.1 primosomal protein N' [Psychrobacter sp. 5A.1]
MLVQVALPVPLYRVFDYSLPAVKLASPNSPMPQIGSRVEVSFGRQTLIGIVVAQISEADSSVPLNKLKPINKCLDAEPILDASMLKLAYWLARYYHYPLGDVLAVTLPTLVRQGKPLDLLITHWRILPHITDDDFRANANKQKQQFDMLKLHGQHGASEDVLLLEGMQRAFLKTLEEKGLVERYIQPKQAPSPIKLAKMPLDLNDEQKLAVDAIIAAHESDTYTGFLLNGITGSGKTEVYLQAMQAVLEAGKQVLILVPEIGLTPQTRARFASRFAAHIVLLHSGMNNTHRLQGWQDCRTGHAQIIIGTRSSILYPFADLGLIVVDEAHDGSYKQQDTLRYHAADVALYRGLQYNIPVVLGTATPSLEHLKLVDDGKLVECQLLTRPGNAKPATMQLIDARLQSTHQQTQDDGARYDTGLTDAMIGAIRQTLEAGDQVLIFLNRRGYAPVLLCEACGWQADCPRCDAHLTVHYNSQSQRNSYSGSSYLKCHHCDWQAYIPTVCPDCGSENLDAKGMGTTRLSENLHAIFANPQTSKALYPIIQIDRDTTRRKDSWENIYQRINEGTPAILVGTQMVAKGHHFPNVTLVCLPNADRGFLSADFRSPEHTAQLMIQVAGRAGRGDKAGRVLIQTLQPDNELLLKLVKDGYLSFARELLQERKMMGLPPHSHAALIRCEGKTLAATTQALKDAIAHLPSAHNLAVLGPIDAPMSKKNSRYHAQLLLLAKDRRQLHHVLAQWWQPVLALPSAKYLKLTLDIDPVGW